MNILPVITLYQPWATWIMFRWKTIESRTHNRFECLIGKTILIHAGMKNDKSDLVLKNPFLTESQINSSLINPINGAILGSVFVDKGGQIIFPNEERGALIKSDYPYRHGLWLKDTTPFEKPIFVKGSMGIWYFDMDTKEKVKNNPPNDSQFALQLNEAR